MESFVNQAHSIERTGMDGAFRVAFHVAHPVDAMSEFTAGGQVGEDHVPRQGKQDIVNGVAVPHGPRYMELEQGRSPVPSLYQSRARAEEVPVIRLWCPQ